MSTREKLLTMVRALGEKPSEDATEAELQSEIDRVLGEPNIQIGSDEENAQANANQQGAVATALAKHGEQAVAKSTGAVLANSGNIPNLSPTGIWQGKRARLKRTPTGNNDMGGAIFGWNGYPTIIPLNQTVDIAWPIFIVIQNCVGMDMEITSEEEQKNKTRIIKKTNITYVDKYPIQYMGVTPGTEQLPESPWEYTLDMYVDDFAGYSVRMWRQLCILWEISDAQAEVKPGISPDKEAEQRSNSIHFKLNLPKDAERIVRERVRDQKRSDISMEAKAA